MFSLENQLELRKVTISSLITCIYLPSIITVISYKGLLYSVGNGSSLYILVLIFVAELLKSVYLNISDMPRKNGKKRGVGEILAAFGFLLFVKFSFFVGIILFGAPFLEYHEQTLILSILMTSLTMLPLVAHVGVESSLQLLFGVKNYAKDTVVDMLVGNAFFTVCGAWLGAVVIPLDWNTPWQQWPIPCYLGAIGGYVLSNVLTVLKVTLMSAAVKYPTLNILVNILNGCRVSKVN